MKTVHHSLLMRTCSLLLIVLIPVLMLQLYNYQWNAGVLQEELTDSASDNVRYLREALSNNISDIVSQQEYLLTHKDTARYLTYHAKAVPSEIYNMQQDLKDHINKICLSHAFVKSVTVYFPTFNEMFTRGFRVDINLRNTAITAIDDLEALLATYAAKKTTFCGGDGEFFTLHGRALPGHDPHCITKVTLDNNAITRLLGAYDAYPNQKAFLLHWGSGMVLASEERHLRLGEDLANAFAPRNTGEVYNFSYESGGRSYVAFCADIPTLDATVVQLIDRQVLSAIPSRLKMLIYVMIFLSLFLAFIYYRQMKRLVDRPVRALVECFRRAGEGDRDVRMDAYEISEFRALSEGFNGMISRLNRLVWDNYRQTILLQQAQLRQLHSQIEPHFLYNSFFMLRHTIEADEIDKAERICDYLGKYFEFITRKDSEFLTLRAEYDNTMNYVAIQGMRFAARLRLQVAPLPEEMAERQVPVLILQPLIENAIEHGMPKTNAVISMTFQKESEDILLIRVEDNGDKLTDEQLSGMAFENRQIQELRGTHALENIHSRLLLHYGPSCGLRFRRSALGGLCVEMRLARDAYTLQPDRRLNDVLSCSDRR